MNILIIGSGMYVGGRGISGYDGTIGPAVLEASKTLDIQKVYLSSLNFVNAERTASTLNRLSVDLNSSVSIEAVPDWQRLAQSVKIDCAIVCTPDDTHASICVELAKLSIHILVVKPMASSLADAKLMADIVEKNNLIGRVEFHKRYDLSNLIAREKIQNGCLGRLQYAYVHYSQRKCIPTDVFSSWCASTNVLQYLGVHYIDLIHWMTNFTPVKCLASGQSDFLNDLGYSTYDSIQLTIYWDRGDGTEFVSHHMTSWIDSNSSPAMSHQKYLIAGTNSILDIDQTSRGVSEISDLYGFEQINPYFSRKYYNISNDSISFKGYGIDSIVDFLVDVYHVSREHLPVDVANTGKPTFNDGLISSAILESAKLSLLNSSIVNIKC